MKIIQNIPGIIRMYRSLGNLNLYRNGIEEARAREDYDKERDNIRMAEDTWSNKIIEMFGSELIVHGKENLPTEGPVVFIGNHQGYADIIAYIAAISPSIAFAFVAKDDLERIPLYGPWMRRIRSVFIKRNDPRASLKAIDEGISLIEKGFSLMIFPEGTRSKGPRPGNFKRGAFRLATKPGVPIIPISLNGSYKMYEETGVIKGARIDVLVHPAVETKDLSRQEEKAMCLAVEKTVKDGIFKLQEIQEAEGNK